MHLVQTSHIAQQFFFDLNDTEVKIEWQKHVELFDCCSNFQKLGILSVFGDLNVSKCGLALFSSTCQKVPNNLCCCTCNGLIFVNCFELNCKHSNYLMQNILLVLFASSASAECALNCTLFFKACCSNCHCVVFQWVQRH